MATGINTRPRIKRVKAFPSYRARSWFRPMKNFARKTISRVGKHWAGKPDVIVFPDGREVCNPGTAGGCAEYEWRKILMWLRQSGRCGICRAPLSLKEATFDHETPRGLDGGMRDDRIAIFEDGRFIRHLNSAAHLTCNFVKGSRRLEVHHGSNCVIEVQP